jgi:excisionase family DNA binding protein
MTTQPLLTVQDAAERLNISKHTLNRWRVTGEGPPFIRYGPRLIRYAAPALDQWASEHQFASTRDYPRSA